MSQAIKRRDSAAANIERYLKMSKKLPADSSRESIVVRTARLKEYWEDYDANQNLVDETCGSGDELDIQNVGRIKIDEYYNVFALINLETFLNSFPTAEPPPVAQPNQTKLNYRL